MRKANSSTGELGGGVRGGRIAPGVGTLHRICNVYTQAPIVEKILDAIKWREDCDLRDSRLLEPSAGDGIFVSLAAQRLISSLRKHKVRLTSKVLSERILAFEIHPQAADEARSRLRSKLREMGLSPRLCEQLTFDWIKCEDFLLASLGPVSFSHVAGNPPYARWSKIPRILRQKYEKHLPGNVAKGDLFLPFLDRSIEFLRQGGRLGFICSDRWKFMAFAEAFREVRLPEVSIECDRSMDSMSSFMRKVDVYSSLLVLQKTERIKPTKSRSAPRTLEDAGFEIRVGPALGCTSAFVLGPQEIDVEASLLAPWFDSTEISDGAVKWSGRRVIVLHNDDGTLRDLKDVPQTAARLRRYRKQLSERAIVKNGALWYRPIDRVMRKVWARPKLVIPELAKIPRVALDTSGAIPSHGTYSIFCPSNDIWRLYAQLRDGGLERALANVSPKVKGGYVRCYRKFLAQISLD
jgi:hypothetical protein